MVDFTITKKHVAVNSIETLFFMMVAIFEEGSLLPSQLAEKTAPVTHLA